MRLINEIPQLEEKISKGELSLSNVAQAKSFFNQEEKLAPLSTHQKIQILEELKNKSSREGEKILLAKLSVPAKPVCEKMKQVTAEITEIKFTADEKLLSKMNRIKGLLAHKKSHFSISELIDELCEMALNKLDPIRSGQTTQITKIEKSKTKLLKDIPPAPKVELLESTKYNVNNSNGKNKNRREYIPVNLRLLCRTCNQRAAIQKLGRSLMTTYLT